MGASPLQGREGRLGWDGGEGAGRGRRLQVMMKSWGERGAPRLERTPGGGAPVALLPAAAPSRPPPRLAASRGPRHRAGCWEPGGPGSAASSRRSPTPFGPGVTCALPPVSGDHGLAGDGVQPGGALGLLAAGVREGADTERERGRGGEPRGCRGTDPGSPPSRQPPASCPPAPAGPPCRPRLFTWWRRLGRPWWSRKSRTGAGRSTPGSDPPPCLIPSRRRRLLLLPPRLPREEGTSERRERVASAAGARLPGPARPRARPTPSGGARPAAPAGSGPRHRPSIPAAPGRLPHRALGGWASGAAPQTPPSGPSRVPAPSAVRRFRDRLKKKKNASCPQGFARRLPIPGRDQREPNNVRAPDFSVFQTTKTQRPSFVL